jgi:predicted Zn-dependent protease
LYSGGEELGSSFTIRIPCELVAHERLPDKLSEYSQNSHSNIDNMDRISALSDILVQDPNNTFARYGLAMEYANSGQVDRALEEFEKLLSSNPDYAAGYFMAAQTLVRAGRAEEAKKKLVDGIAAAGRKRDAHAESEMQAMLQEIGG